MTLKTLAAAVCLSMAMASTATAATLLSYVSTNGTELAPTTTAPGVTGGVITRGIGLAENAGTTFNSANWTIGGDSRTAFEAGDALVATINFGQSVQLSSFEFAYDRSGNGPQAIALDFLTSSESNTDFFIDTDVSEDSESAASIDLSGFAPTDTLTFFILGYNATGLDGTFDLENRLVGDLALVISGDVVAAVPLPAGGLLLLSGLGGIAAFKRRKKRAA